MTDARVKLGHPRLWIIALTGLTVMQGQAFGDTRSHSFSGFTGVSVASGVSVIVQQGAFNVIVDAEERRMADLSMSVTNGSLRIARTSRMTIWNGASSDIVVTVTMPAIISLEASSGSDIRGSDLRLENLTLSVSGGASIDLNGTCATLRASASSGAQLNGDNLSCRSVQVDAASGASITTRATEAIEAKAASGASVRILGRPQRVKMSSSAGGAVTSE